MTDFKELQRPIIFIGSGRTGTTIIYELICRHPSLAYPSNYQQKFYKRPIVNLARNLFDNRLWRIFGQKRQLNRIHFLNKYHFIPGENFGMWNYLVGPDIDFSRDFLLTAKIDQKRIDFIRNYFMKMVKFQNRERLIMKINGAPRITFLRQIFPDAIFICLKRNKIPTLSSFLKVSFWKTRGYNKLWWTGAYSDEELKWANTHKDRPELITMFQLMKIDKVTEQESKQLNLNLKEIHYEDFVDNPSMILQDILEFADLKPYDYTETLKTIKIFNQNKRDQDYFSEDQLKDLKSMIDKWS